jgi:hypothetical protein
MIDTRPDQIEYRDSALGKVNSISIQVLINCFSRNEIYNTNLTKFTTQIYYYHFYEQIVL